MNPATAPHDLLRQLSSDSVPKDLWPAVIAVVCAHIVGISGLLLLESVQAVVRDVAPSLLEFVVAVEPRKPEVSAPAPRPTPVVKTPTPPRPTVIAAEPTPQAPPATFTAPPSELLPVVVQTAPAPVIAAPPAPPAAPPPAAPRVLPASAVQYLVQPPIEVPALSRRLNEQGTAWLRVRVGRDGLPQQITLQKSSGYDRLDRQAMDAMRAARFKPQTENGLPIEWVVTAPLQYDIE